MSPTPEKVSTSTLPQEVPHHQSSNFVSAYTTGAVVSGPLNDGSFQLLFVEDFLQIDTAKVVYNKDTFTPGEMLEASLDYSKGPGGNPQREIICRLRLSAATMQQAAMLMLQQLAQAGQLQQVPGLSTPVPGAPTSAR